MNRLSGLIDIFLQPGEFFVADADYQMRTMLGSCVSITLWHPFKRIGAMSHFLLPTRGNRQAHDLLDGRYGDEALDLMVAELKRAGVVATQCQAKIFGGGNMFPEHFHSRALSVGQRNGEAALQLLDRHGIPVVSESLFGIGHRQIIFDVSNGDVWCHQVPPSSRDGESEGDLL
ncbi:MAG: chemotaxis protein CheD [Rhodoferax sp.]|nr:chemotaxis protein CheD [Rhodoferax sp.]MCF8209404.1 chemotaxis protein CheD [Rhodoferax sp.]